MKKLLYILSLVFILFFSLFLSGQANIDIYFLDVGQGDASLIISSTGEVVLIDSGPNTGLILNHLRSLNINHIDLIIASHAHSDHITGMDQIIEKYNPRALMDPGIPHTTKTYERMIDAIQTNNVKYYEGTSRRLSLGPMRFTILPPAHPLISVSELNNNSIVVRLDYQDFSCLFTGDIEGERERNLYSKAADFLDVNILKIPHHGSSSSSTDVFIKAVNPEIGIISCGEDNSYGHPHVETLALLQELGIDTYRTDKNGTILIQTDGKKYSIQTEKYAPRAPPIITEEKPTKIEEPAQKKAPTYKYAASRNSNVFHYIWCHYVNRIKPSNLILFTTREQAIASGRRPCKVCSP